MREKKEVKRHHPFLAVGFVFSLDSRTVLVLDDSMNEPFSELSVKVSFACKKIVQMKWGG